MVKDIFALQAHIIKRVNYQILICILLMMLFKSFLITMENFNLEINFLMDNFKDT
jgi:hypothetical protein